MRFTKPHNMSISKTTYKDYLHCPKNTWLKLHKKQELLEYFKISDADQAKIYAGYLTEEYARKQFPHGVFISGYGDKAIKLTNDHIEQKTPVLFQATFSHNDFLIKTDIFTYSEITKKWSLYEVKSKTSVEEKTDNNDHIEDATFQALVLSGCGIELEKICIIHLNPDYIRNDNINIEKLFLCVDITDEVRDREFNTEIRMHNAKAYLLNTYEPLTSCTCITKLRSNHCDTFNYSNPHIPTTSIHDISRISGEKLETLVSKNIFTIDEIPNSFPLTKNQELQVKSTKTKYPIISLDEIDNALHQLTYPLYFLDYESHSSPIPPFNGFRPWQQVPFQLSLHVMHSPESELVHFEYLHEYNTDPSEFIVTVLRKHIGSLGNIISWHKSFEQMINKELAQRLPEYANFLQNLNERIFDLENIFTKQYYVDGLFKGKTSIKYVLPVLIKDLSYDDYAIRSGDIAAIT